MKTLLTVNHSIVVIFKPNKTKLDGNMLMVNFTCFISCEYFRECLAMCYSGFPGIQQKLNEQMLTITTPACSIDYISCDQK